MKIEEEIENKNLIEIYLGSRATEFSKLFNGLSALILEYLATHRLSKRKMISPFLIFKKNQQFSIILSFVLMLSLTTGLSMMGLLHNKPVISQIHNIKINTGFWQIIPMHESISKIFRIENQRVHPLTLDLLIINWNPIVSENILVTWNYNGTLLLPGDSTDITITLKNVGLEGGIVPSLDIHIIG